MSNDQEQTQEVVSRAGLPPVAFTLTEEGLAKLREKNSKLTKITAENYDLFKSNVRELTSLRTGIETERNEQLKHARKHTVDVNDEAKRITALVTEIEAGPAKLKKDYDTDQKAIKEKAERENQERTDAINAKINLIEQRGTELEQYDAAELTTQLSTMKAATPTEDVFQEFLAVALERWESTIARIESARYKRIDYERQQQELAEEKEKLAQEKIDADAAQKVIDDANAAAQKKLDDDRAEFEAEKQAKADADAAADTEKRETQEAADAAKKAEDDAAEQATRDAQIAEDAAEAERNRIAQETADQEAADAEALLMAPDKVKLARYATIIEAIAEDAPELGHAKAQKVLARSVAALTQVAANLAATAEKL